MLRLWVSGCVCLLTWYCLRCHREKLGEYGHLARVWKWLHSDAMWCNVTNVLVFFKLDIMQCLRVWLWGHLWVWFFPATDNQSVNQSRQIWIAPCVASESEARNNNGVTEVWAVDNMTRSLWTKSLRDWMNLHSLNTATELYYMTDHWCEKSRIVWLLAD